MSQTYSANPWNERYGKLKFFYGSEPNDFLREQAHQLPRKGRILFLAEGEGRNAVWFAAQAPEAEVVGVDGSDVGLTKARELAGAQGAKITTVTADLTQYDLGSQKWDAIVSIWAHLPEPQRADLHHRCVKALKPGGAFLLEAYTPKQLTYKTGGPPVVELLMTAEALQTELSGLEFSILCERDREVHEGTGHDGMSAVVQVLAVRPN
jgi:2-polyprenyl-3-methyl-5-hydroxy-6-metoxy-1,4-benzoquinol methylase